MKILMCGGGTGGHVNPAIAIAAQIKKAHPDAEIAFVGTKRGIESTLVPKAGYPISFVEVQGFKRKISLSNIKAAVKAVTSVREAKKIIKAFKPDLVIGTGGYVSWPAVKAASKLGIPCLIHEQNAFPGKTTRMLSKYADKICVSFAESIPFFDQSTREKIFITGNPINTDKIDYNRARRELGIAPGEKYILSAGGSMGAERVNELVFDLMEEYSIPEGIRHSHAVGRTGWEKFSAESRERGLDRHKNIEISEYIYDMPKRQAAADLIIGRAGALTMAELAYRGKAAVFIPSPHVTDDHQYKNAKTFADAGAAVVFRESELDAQTLINTVKRLLSDPGELKRMRDSVSAFAKPEAAERIAGEALSLIIR